MNTILLVDDTPDNLRILMKLLSGQGYEVSAFSEGSFALEAARRHPPDLILLDIRMPGMDGYQVCEQLKVDPRTCDIPVIFISALSDLRDEVKGFEIGGVDYITKPFRPEEVVARVSAHLTLYRLRRQLEEKNTELQQAYETLKQQNGKLAEALDHLKTMQQEFIQAGKMAALGHLVAGVAHEINTPVGVGITGASYLEDMTQEFRSQYQANRITKSGLEEYLNSTEKTSRMILTNLQHVAEQIRSFKQITAAQDYQEKRRFDLKTYVDDVLLSLQPNLKSSGHTMLFHCPENLLISSYPGAFAQILTHLIMNSLTHGFEDIPQGEIGIRITQDNTMLRLQYSDNGRGMTPEEYDHLFEPFYTTKRGQRRSGLGLHIVYNLVHQTLNGQIECRSESGQGIAFLIQIPLET